ncbi:fimbrial protein [Serratia sp. (in: enterobacteria)]|uniref:fimbrial protein n=1 Tax=Serratia sp. (in: enterobacteria) TaxID=616 RepID=UPI003989ACFF
MRRMIHIIVVLSCMLIALPFTAIAGSSVRNMVFINMEGSIIDAACTIAVESRDQTVNMGVVPLNDIIRDGHGQGKSFTVKLLDCELDRPGLSFLNKKSFRITFDGDAEGDLFSVQGMASGIALRLHDALGNIVKPGQPLLLQHDFSQSTNLNYTSTLVANNQIFKAGEYFSAVRFTLDYF